MNYIAYKNIEKCSDTLRIDDDLVDIDLDNVYTLVNLWFTDRGCDNLDLLTNILKTLEKVYNNEITYSECNDFDNCQVVIKANPLENYITITYNYNQCIGLCYKESNGN